MIWYSYKGIPYTGNCPAYYDLSSKIWFADLKKNHDAIKSLVLHYLNQEGIEVEKYFNTELVAGKESWKVSPFVFWSERNEKNISRAKDLFSLFQNIPGITGLAISILPSQTSVNPHYGDTDAVYRLHIPIKIHAALPVCGLKVNGIEKSWGQNELLAFCDAHLHEAWNHSTETRIVLIADILREEYVMEQKNICLNVLSLLQLQQLANKHKWINSFPALGKGILRIILKTVLFIKS